ncbi:aminopeptidase Ey-like [Rhipicephalus microplus]|uniref:aminopeptidase Ey-like n=1 Tax=Rhipicephalus microplus TaxID=6941 RepID=UPI003F6BA727
MRSSPSMDKVLLLRRGRPQSSYTIDTPSWGEKSRFHSFRNNLCVGNRNVTIALFGFLGAILAVAGTLAYVHSGGHGVYEPLVNDYDAATATSALIVVAPDALASRRSSPSPHKPAAAPFLITKKPSTRRHRPVARMDRRSPRRTPKNQLRERGIAAPATGHSRRREKATMAVAGRAATTMVTKQEETAIASTEEERKKRQQRLQQQTRSPQSLAEDEDDTEVEDKVAASAPLPKHLVPRHYSVLLHPHNDGSRFVFTGVVKINVKCVESTRQVVLHAAGIQVNNAKVSFNAVAANRSAVHEIPVRRVDLNNSTQQVTLELASFLHAQVNYDISISYVGSVSRWPKGLYKASYELRNGSEMWVLFTRMRPRYARRVFPCFDDPSYRATFDVEVLRRKDFNSISSMPILKIEMSHNHNDYVNDVFVRTPPIPTYMLGFAVTDFTHIGTETVKVWSEPSSLTRAEVVLQTATAGLQLYEKYFRTRYPLPKLDIIVTPGGGEPSASEGVVFFPSSYLTRHNVSLDARKQAEWNIYRHILKQWIGGLVNFHSWRELWLEAALEGYILHALARMQNTKLPEDEDRLQIKMQQMLSLEVTQEIPALSRDDSLPDADTSLAARKGELLLHMFDSVVGSDSIRNALQELMVKRKHGTITEEDLWEELSNVNNESFPGAVVAHTWTHSAGFPLLTISRVYGQRVVIARQERYGQNSSQTIWSIPVTYTDGTKMDFDNTGNIFWLKTKEAKLPTAPKDDDWLIANLRGCGYYRVNYDPRNWNIITMELNMYHTNIDVVNRARIIDDVFELADLGLVPYGTALHASEYLRREKETLPWTTVLKRWEYLEAMLADEAVLEKWKLFIIRILIHHIHSFKWSNTQEDSAKRQLRIIHYAWACRYKYGPCLIEARHAFESYKSPESTAKPILPEHQFTVFCTVIEDGDEAAWIALRTRLDQVSNGVERRNIILALGCTRDTNRLTRYFEEFSVPAMKMVPLLFTEVAKRGNFWRLRTADYVIANWQGLKSTYPRLFPGIIASVFKYVSSYEELSEVSNLVKRHRWSLLRYSGTFDKIHEIAKRNMKWVASYYDEVARWLKRDVAEFILDDQVLHGNGTLSGNDTRNEEDSDNLEVGNSDDFETRDIPEHGVSDGDIAERNSSYSQELRDRPFNRDHNERVSKLSETTTGMNYGNESLVKRNADSHEASDNADIIGTRWSLNRSIEASYLEAVQIQNDVRNGANESDAPVSPVAEESSLNKIEPSESYSQGYAKQSRESNATKSVMTSANVTSSAVSSQESATERLTRKKKLDNASFETAEQKRPEDVYTDTTRTIQDFEHVFITKNYRDSLDGLGASEPTMSSVNVSLNTRNGGVAEKAEIVFPCEYRDEGAAINERVGEGTRMDKETAEDVSKKVERIEISANSQDEDYSDTTVIIKDFEHLFITKHFRDSRNDLKATGPAVPSVNDNVSQNTRNRGTAEGAVRYFTSKYKDEGAAVNGGAGKDIRIAKATAVDLSKEADYVQISESSRNRSEGSGDNTRRNVARNVSASMKAADVPAVKSNAFLPEHLNEDLGNTVHYPDYIDTSVIITRFEDIFLTRHYIGSLGNSAPVDNVPASKKLSGSSEASVARKARRHVGAGNRDERVSQIKIKTP